MGIGLSSHSDVDGLGGGITAQMGVKLIDNQFGRRRIAEGNEHALAGY
jgi:hypothetical protein